MKMVDINKKLTDKVAEYIAQGYIINTSSMSGHQGEIGKVDLLKGKTLVRVWLDSEPSWGDDEGFYGNILVLRVGTYNKDYIAYYYDSTAWMKDFDVSYVESFYEIYRHKWYVETLEEATRIQDIRRNKRNYYANREGYIIDNPKAKEICARYLKRVHGYQRVSQDAIIIKKYVGRYGHISYKFYYKSKYYVIG